MGPVLVQIGLRPVFGSDGETGSTASEESSEGSAFFEGAAALLPAPDAV
jgi:hypothetical protein